MEVVKYVKKSIINNKKLEKLVLFAQSQFPINTMNKAMWENCNRRNKKRSNTFMKTKYFRSNVHFSPLTIDKYDCQSRLIFLLA